MRTIGVALLAMSFVAGCAMDDGTGYQSANSDRTLSGTLTEYAYYNSDQCKMIWQGTDEPDADMFFIWNLGVGGWLRDAAYPTDARPNLYGIFAPAPGKANHHVDGWDQYDHYHLVDSGPGQDNYDGTWDVFVVFPGPSFDASTYVVARSIDQLNQQVADGVLGAPMLTSDVGFDPLVMNVPLSNCHRSHLDDGDQDGDAQ